MIKIHSNSSNLSVNSFLYFLILLSIFFLPFNGFPYFKNIFGELYLELSYYPLYFFFLFFWFRVVTKKIEMGFPKDKIFNFWAFSFCFWIIISFFVNYSSVSNNLFRQRSGFEKFGLQFFLIIFLYLLSLSLYNFLKNVDIFYFFEKVKKIIFYSFVLIFIFGFFEFLYKFTNLKLDFIKSIECLVSINCHGYGDRLKFFGGEPSFFGIYLTFALPFFLAHIIEFNRKIYAFLVLNVFYFFSYFTFSRTVWIIILFQTFVFIVLILFKKKSSFNKKILVYFFILSLFIFFSGSIMQFLCKTGVNNFPAQNIIESFKKDSYYSISNNSRKTMQLIGIQMGYDNFVFGVGLGQYVFSFPKYVEREYLFNPEMRESLDSTKLGVWPSVHGFFSRLFAELGFIGLLLWIFIWGYVYFSLLKRFMDLYEEKLINFYIILLVIIPSLLLLGFSTDSFRFLGYWFTLSLSLITIEKTYEKQNLC